MSSRAIVIRADASSEIGIGHVMRCLALGRAWQSQGGRVVFALAQGASDLAQRIRAERTDIVTLDTVAGSAGDAARTLQLLELYEAAWLIVDGYHFSSDYLCSFGSSKSSRLLVLTDDDKMPSCDCHIVVDPSIVINGAGVKPNTNTLLLQGPAYALLRTEFLQYANHSKSIPEKARHILITFGGSDFPNASLAVVQALQEIVDVELDVAVVIGPSNPHRMTLEAAAERSRHRVRLLESIHNMAEVMVDCDLAVAGGGGTCYELAYMRVPMFLIAIAENQKKTVEACAMANAAISGGMFGTLDRSQLSKMLAGVVVDRILRYDLTKRARKLVDGHGAERVVERMLAFSSERTRHMEQQI